MKVLGIKMTLKNIALLVIAALGILYVLKLLGVKMPLLEHQMNNYNVEQETPSNAPPSIPTPPGTGAMGKLE